MEHVERTLPSAALEPDLAFELDLAVESKMES